MPSARGASPPVKSDPPGPPSLPARQVTQTEAPTAGRLPLTPDASPGLVLPVGPPPPAQAGAGTQGDRCSVGVLAVARHEGDGLPRTEGEL